MFGTSTTETTRPWQTFPDPVFSATKMVAKNGKWEYNENFTDFFCSLLKSQDQNARNPAKSVKVFPLPANIFATPGSANLVIRPEQEQALALAMELRQKHVANRIKNSIVLLIGAPGIGKSWSVLFYVRLLAELKQKRPILYEFGSKAERQRLLFVPPAQDGNNVDWVCYATPKSDAESFAGLDMLGRQDMDVVIDPLQAAESEAAPTSPLFASARGHVFVPMSPNAKYPGAHRKAFGTLDKIIINPCSLSTILEIQEPMGFEHVPDIDVRRNYYRFGGLPRYIFEANKGDTRWDSMNKSQAKGEVLLRALTEQDLQLDVVQSTFFAWRMPGGFGHWSESNSGQVGFVSLGATEKGGLIIMSRLNQDTIWRTASDCSAIGLAFEQVILAFLHRGDEGMLALGVEAKCRKLVDLSATSTAQSGNQKVNLDLTVKFRLSGSASASSVDDIMRLRGGLIETYSDVEFYDLVTNGCSDLVDDGVDRSVSGEIACSAPLTLAPVGHAVADAMCGKRVSFNATLQKNHTIKGAAYIQQRKKFGLTKKDKSILLFVVPKHRFADAYKNRQYFDWTCEEGTKVSAAAKKAARDSLEQYVLVVSPKRADGGESTDETREEVAPMDES